MLSEDPQKAISYQLISSREQDVVFHLVEPDLDKSDTVNITQFSHTPDRLHHICTHPEYQSDYLSD